MDCYIDVRIPIPAGKLVEAKRVYWMIKKTAGLEIEGAGEKKS